MMSNRQLAVLAAAMYSGEGNMTSLADMLNNSRTIEKYLNEEES